MLRSVNTLKSHLNANVEPKDEPNHGFNVNCTQNFNVHLQNQLAPVAAVVVVANKHMQCLNQVNN